MTLHRPKVLLYSATPRSDRGGVQRMMADLQRMLPAHGFDVARAGPDETLATGGLPFVAPTDAGSAGRPALAALPAAGGALVRMFGLLRRVRPDVVNVHFITGEAAYLLALRRLCGFRLLLSAHGGDLLRPTPQMRHHLPRILGNADAVTTVSAELTAAALAFAPGRAAVQQIANGVDTGFWCPADAPPVPGRIVAAGRLLPIKGFDLLIDAMAGLPQAHLRILGDGTERAALQQRIDRAGLGGRVALLGHLAPERMRDEFRQAQVFAMPSRGEGMPLALLEALACGCPAVAAAVGAIPDVLADAGAGTVVPPEDVGALRGALAGAIAQAAGDAGASRAAARSRAECYAQSATYDAYARLLHRMAAPESGDVRSKA